MAEHTKLPWRVKNRTIMTEHGVKVASATVHSGGDTFKDDGIAEANAALIVRAANSHEALVKALTEIAYPVRAMQDRLQPGEKLDGVTANALANNADYLRAIALKALSVASHDRGREAACRAYYNEIEPYAAQWLRNLIAADLIAPGDVDERSIVDVRPSDLAGYTQCHFFAGIGVWSAALRQAEWPDDRQVWTGSCPCQPFSAAGKGDGFADERHLWPAWYHLIRECQPSIVFGEQVASPNGYSWLDLVQADLEGAAYTCGPVVLPAAGFGAPHGRHRIFYVAHPAGGGQRELRHQAQSRGERHPDLGSSSGRLVDADSERGCCGPSWGADAAHAGQSGEISKLGNASGARGRRHTRTISGEEAARQGEWIGVGHFADQPFAPGRSGSLADTAGGQLPQPIGRSQERDGAGSARKNNPDAPTNGFWLDADWIYCRDEKWRAVEPSTFPLVNESEFGVGSGSSLEGKSRTKMLRGYGNAIVKEVAAEFIIAADAALRAPAISSKDGTGGAA